MLENKVKKEPLSEKIASSIRKDIFAGVYKPGQRLPIEQKLADRFGTSRGTLRQALQTLNQEGWIETVQGRGNTVCDFRETVAIDVIPDLIMDCPEAVFTPQFIHFLADFNSFLFEQMFLAAADNAKPEDEPRLMELMLASEEGITVTDFWENDARYFKEILRIGDNMLLQMSYNLLLQITDRMMESGIMRNLLVPIPVYREIHSNMIKAVCAGDRKKISALFESYKKHFISMYQNLILNVSDYSLKRSQS